MLIKLGAWCHLYTLNEQNTYKDRTKCFILIIMQHKYVSTVCAVIFEGLNFHESLKHGTFAIVFSL